MQHPLGPYPPMYHALHQKDGCMTTFMTGFVVIYATSDYMTTKYYIYTHIYI
jgi:hypothetical protein